MSRFSSTVSANLFFAASQLENVCIGHIDIPQTEISKDKHHAAIVCNHSSHLGKHPVRIAGVGVLDAALPVRQVFDGTNRVFQIRQIIAL